MDKFERTWRNKIIKHTFLQTDTEITDKIIDITENDPITYTKILIKRLKNMTVDEKIKHIFIQSACHLPHNKLDEAKKVYEKTKSIEKARDVLEQSFKIDIKEYKNLSDQQVDEIIELGWGLPGLFNEGDIIATKIPSMFHEYLNETDELKKKYYYCHCPRIRKELLTKKDIDSIYCNCGGGFYVDVWEYITGKTVEIDVIKNLFDNDDVCQFKISFK